MIRRTVGDTRVTYPVGPILKARFLHTKSKVCPKQGVPGETSPTALRKCIVWDWNRAWCGVTEREKSVQGVCDLVSPTVRTQATGSGETPGQSGQQGIYFSRKKYVCFWTCVYVPPDYMLNVQVQGRRHGDFGLFSPGCSVVTFLSSRFRSGKSFAMNSWALSNRSCLPSTRFPCVESTRETHTHARHLTVPAETLHMFFSLAEKIQK